MIQLQVGAIGLWLVLAGQSTGAAVIPDDRVDLQLSPAPPVITPSNDTITLTVNEPQTLLCTHFEDITWSIPEKVNSAFYTISPSTPSAAGTFETSITFNYHTTDDPAHTLVGSYNCLSKTLAASARSTALLLNYWHAQNRTARTFIYLKEAETKMTCSSEHITAFLDSTVYFPCWATDGSNATITTPFYEVLTLTPLLHLGLPFNVTKPDDFGSYTCAACEDSDTTIELQQMYVTSASIEMEHYGWGEVGGRQRFTCTVNSTSDQDIGFLWSCPGRPVCGSETQSTLTLENLTKADDGKYTCTVTDRNPVSQHPVRTASCQLDIVTEPFVNIGANQELNYESAQGADLKMFIFYKAYPMDKPPEWTSPILERMDTNRYYFNHTKDHETKAELTIRGIQLDEAGPFTLAISSTRVEPQLRVFHVTVTAAPTIEMTDQYARPGHNATFRCNVTAFPPATVGWVVEECKMRFRDCKPLTDITNVSKTIEWNDYTVEHVLNYTPRAPSWVTCNAHNRNNTTYRKQQLYIMERDQHFLIDAPADFVAGLSQRLDCFASKYEYVNVDWIRDRRSVTTQAGLIVSSNSSDYMFQTTITFDKVTEAIEGNYICRGQLARGNEHKELNRSVTVNPYAPVAVVLQSSASAFVEGSGPLRLSCVPAGMPRPTSVEWYFNDKRLSSGERITLTDTGLTLDGPTADDIGTYKCVARSPTGWDEDAVDEFKYRKSNDTIIIVASLLTGFGVIASVAVFVFYRSQKKKRHCEPVPDTSSESITMKKDVRYKPEFEVGIDQVQLDTPLDSGEFGEVWLANAVLGKNKPKTEVAVKRAIGLAGEKALVAEVLFMMGLRQHRNVVALLGVVNDGKRLMAITELCEMGNLRNIMLTNRDYFVNQMDPIKDCIDVNVTTIAQQHPQLAKVYENTVGPSTEPTDCDVLLESDSGEKSAETAGTASGFAFTTTDLVCWSYQVAQGMYFVARNGLVHNDLAARNILMTSDHTVKISDFGLSRQLLPESHYTKTGTDQLPVKWMAIEALKDGVFNTSTDIWSYGVLVWELFTLGRTPYAHRNADMLDYLKRGYRLERPEYATADLYALMRGCWKAEPADRTRFDVLAERLQSYLPPALVQKHKDTQAVYMTCLPNSTASVDRMMAQPDDVAPCADGMSVPMLTLTRNASCIHDAVVGQTRF